MKKSFIVKVEMNPVEQIIKAHGLDKDGDVQQEVTNIINDRITRYMPYLTGILATKKKFVKSPTMIKVDGPYAKYQYFGKKMVGPKPKVVTDQDLNYSKFQHPLAGPFWDRKLMAAEGEAIVNEVNEYIRRSK